MKCPNCGCLITRMSKDCYEHVEIKNLIENKDGSIQAVCVCGCKVPNPKEVFVNGKVCSKG